MEKKALLFMDGISTLYNIPLKELKKIWNNPKELIPKEKVINFCDSWTGKPPSPLTVNKLLEYMDNRPEYKEMVK